MTLHQKLQLAKSEEDVKDAYIKALGLKGYSKNLIDIQTKEIWFEAKDTGRHSTYAMFTQLMHYVQDALNKGEYIPPFLCVIDTHKAAIMKTADVLPFLEKKTIKWGKSASGYTQEALDAVSAYIGTYFVSFKIETPDRLRQMWLFEYVDYVKGTGSFSVKINETAKPYFFELKNNFTAMQLKSVLNCSSKYAKRLYAIACQWRSVGTKRFEIKELKQMLGLIDKKGIEQFERISDFKKFVLDVARKQISENTDIELDYELKKRGRSFHWVTLHINSQKFRQMEIDFNMSLDIQKFKSDLMAYGLNKEQSTLIAENEKRKDFEILITDLNLKIQQGKIKPKNTVAYLVGVYQKKGIIPNKE